MALSKELFPNDPAYAKVAANDKLFGQGIIQLVVGKTRIKFEMHQEALAQVSDSFARAFYKDPLNVKLGVMHLPDEDPDMFQHFIKWAYSKHSEDSSSSARANLAHAEAQFRNVSRKGLLCLYLAGHKLQARTLQDEILMLFYERLHRGIKKIASLGIDDDFLAHLDTHLDERTTLYKLLVNALAYRMATQPYTGIPFRKRPDGPRSGDSSSSSSSSGATDRQDDCLPNDTPPHPYPSNLSRAILQYAAGALPERLLRNIVGRFFSLHAMPVVNDFIVAVGSLEVYLVA